MISKWKITVSEHLDKGSRGYMEDFTCNHFEIVNGKVLFGIFGVFDGHGGFDAANYVKNNFVEELKRNDKFWSNNDNTILIAIKEVYHRLQNLMWIEREKWPQTITGYKSTAGTTATIAIIRNGKLYVGHVGDSAIVLANHSGVCGLKSEQITQEHKPSDIEEMKRIEKCGGSLKRKAGILRIVWNRKKITKNETEHVPFLAVARSLGDLWSYDLNTNSYHVSPEPDVLSITLNPHKHRALILASDGVWNVVNGDTSVNILSVSNNLQQANDPLSSSINPAQLLIKYSLFQWRQKNMRPDNLCAIVVQLTPCNDLEYENVGVNCSVAELQSEILNNGIVINGENLSQSTVILENVDNWMDYCPQYGLTLHNHLEETELLKMCILSADNLAKHCVAWRHDLTYWNQLKVAFTNNGITSFPNWIANFDYSVSLLEDLLQSFSWSLICLQCIEKSHLFSKRDKEKIESRALLSEFWVSFYRKIISPNLCFTAEQLTDQSIYRTIIGHILVHKTTDIQRLLNDISYPPLAPFTLNKCQSYTNTNTTPIPILTGTQTVYTCYQLQRSSSLEICAATNQSSVLPIITASNLSTPIMSPSHCDNSMRNNVHQTIPGRKRRRTIISFSSKRNISKNVSRLCFVSYKNGSKVSGRRLVRYVARNKARTQ